MSFDLGQSDNGVYVGVGAENVEVVEVEVVDLDDKELLDHVSACMRNVD